jgi:predicted  nucleic acid-binding Zn-ribbon protein
VWVVSENIRVTPLKQKIENLERQFAQLQQEAQPNQKKIEQLELNHKKLKDDLESVPK